MLIPLIILITSIIGLLLSSEIIIKSLRKIARHFNISELLIGITVVAIGTSLPEVATNISAGFKKASGVAIGNIVGSNITNICLLLGMAGLFSMLFMNEKTKKREGRMIVIAVVLMLFAFLDFKISQLEGAILILVYIIYLIYVYIQEKRLKKIKVKGRHPAIRLWFWIPSAIIGFIALIFSSNYTVNSAISLAQLWGIPQTIIGIFIIGIGTSLPELTVILQGIRKRAKGLSIGTLIGSNISNPLLALGSGAIITGYSISKNIVKFDMIFLLIVTIIALFFLERHDSFDKKRAAFLIALFAFYVYMRLFVINGVF
ncbi:MAG: calcium/sodium antiporter [Nanoarchaeota archaeon]|nr:calcium/sodium antiporter [Nanoarchaeota archaeon]